MERRSPPLPGRGGQDGFSAAALVGCLSSQTRFACRSFLYIMSGFLNQLPGHEPMTD